MSEIDHSILLTGSNGFIGKHLSKNLQTLFQNIINLDKDLPKGNIGCVNLLDAAALENIFRNYFPRTVIHLAAQTDVRRSISNPEIDAMNNIIATINLSKLAVKYETKRFIYFNSGGAIYCQSSNLKPCEDSKTDPKSPYGISKLASEVYAKQILSESNVEFLSLRLSNVYGDGQINGVITKFIKNMSAGLPCNFYGDGSSTRNYLHVLDLIEFLKMALRQEFVGVYNLGSDRSTSLIELFHIIRSNYTSNVSIKYLESIHKEVKNSDLCIDKALKTGWKPSISLEDGVRNLVISNKVNSFIDGINENV